MTQEKKDDIKNRTIQSEENRSRNSLLNNLKEGYEQLILTIIRPPKCFYSVDDLGPTPFYLNSETFIRSDFQLKNNTGKTIECSWWRPDTISDIIKKPMPCIISLHGNSSCRLSCMEIIQYALTNGFTLVSFDFTGSGLSEGEYVSLGYHESYDLQVVIGYLRSTGNVSNIILWGRSMGAVAAMLYTQRDNRINAMVLDSPFSKLSKLANDLVKEGKLNVPKLAIKFVFPMVRRDIIKRSNFDINDLEPIKNFHKCLVPIYIGVAKDDQLIPPHHGESLYELHKGPKKIYHFTGGHNGHRPKKFYIDAIKFVSEMIGLPVSSNFSNKKDNNNVQKENMKNKTRKFKNINEISNIEEISEMTTKELKYVAGKESIHCIEKEDLIHLVTELYRRSIIMNSNNSKTTNTNEKSSI